MKYTIRNNSYFTIITRFTIETLWFSYEFTIDAPEKKKSDNVVSIDCEETL